MCKGGEVKAEYSLKRFLNVDPVSAKAPLEYTAFYDCTYIHGKQVQIGGGRQVSQLSANLKFLFSASHNRSFGKASVFLIQVGGQGLIVGCIELLHEVFSQSLITID